MKESEPPKTALSRNNSLAFRVPPLPRLAALQRQRNLTLCGVRFGQGPLARLGSVATWQNEAKSGDLAERTQTGRLKKETAIAPSHPTNRGPVADPKQDGGAAAGAIRRMQRPPRTSISWPYKNGLVKTRPAGVAPQ
jgi:hypothetical protein